MAGIDYHGFQFTGLKDVVQGFPIGCRALHGNHLTTALFEPVSHFEKLPGCCTEVPYFLFAAFFEAGHDELLVHINTTTFVVNFLHFDTSDG